MTDYTPFLTIFPGCEDLHAMAGGLDQAYVTDVQVNARELLLTVSAHFAAMPSPVDLSGWAVSDREEGTRFVFPSDEMICIAGHPLPEEEYYENYPQIENGVGLMRQFLNGLIGASQSNTAQARPRRVVIPCGTSIAPYMQQWVDRYGPSNVAVRVQAIKNRYFGETVTVTGLLTGRDILEQLDTANADEVILCNVTLREAGDLFLDDLPVSEFRAALPVPLSIIANRGDALYGALLGFNKEA